jgi:hypothetical protein
VQWRKTGQWTLYVARYRVFPVQKGEDSGMALTVDISADARNVTETHEHKGDFKEL